MIIHTTTQHREGSFSTSFKVDLAKKYTAQLGRFYEGLFNSAVCRVVVASLCLSIFALQPSQAQLLWEISGKDLAKPSYLYGTVHVGDERAYQFMDSLMPRIDAVDMMAGELALDMSLMQSMDMMMSLFMPNDTTLKMLLPKDRYEEAKSIIDQRLNESGMIMLSGMMERIKPAFTSMMLMSLEQMGNMQQGGSLAGEKPPLDLHLQNVAKRMDKEVIGLETMKEQVSVFDRIPLTKQADMLYEELSASEEGAESAEQSLEKMLDWYAAGRLDSLYSFSYNQMDNEMIDALLNGRNHNMADRMIPYLQQGKTLFVAVGAAHLPGEQGVIELLREKGYTVKAVEL